MIILILHLVDLSLGYPKGTQDWDFEQNKRLLQNGSTRNPSCKWGKNGNKLFSKDYKMMYI